jgi:ABC-2 type transport system ATP-binding protein
LSASSGAGALAVEVEGLTRVYRLKRAGRHTETVLALEEVDLTVGLGEVHGLLGPNGAGKTTLIKVLTTVLLPTAGRARVLGFDVVRQARSVRPRIGIVLGGDRGLYGRLSARQNLLHWAAMYEVPRRVARERTDYLLQRMGLAARADEPVEAFSRGMKQRLHIARGLVGDPELLFLDEPALGLDPVAALEFRSLVLDLRSEGLTMLLATHDMREAESLCDRVSLIDRGRILATESPRRLGQWIARYERVDVRGADPAVLASVRGIPGVSQVATTSDGSARVYTVREEAVRRVLETLVGSGLTQVSTSLPSLEEVYLEVFGRRGMTV